VPRVLGLLPSALVAARGNMSANQFYSYLQSLGMGARRADVLKIYKVATGIVARSGDEVFSDIRQVPTAAQIQAWPSRKATGFLQTVTLVYRDRTTGVINQTYWKTSNPEPLTRETAVATAIDAYSEHAESYDQDLIGAVHTSTYSMQPDLVTDSEE
jgi:hypothetical protein